MNILDHKRLAETILERVQGRRPVSWPEQMAFVLGNMEPDMIPLTYLHGFRKGTRFHGHNFENMHHVMGRLVKRLTKGHGGWRQYFYAGVLTHYLADAFTYPHNQAFAGDLKEHVAYEIRMHDMWSARGYGAGDHRFLPVLPGHGSEAEDVMDYIYRAHEMYLECREKMEDDISCIAFVTEQVCRICLADRTEETALVPAWYEEQTFLPAGWKMMG